MHFLGYFRKSKKITFKLLVSLKTIYLMPRAKLLNNELASNRFCEYLDINCHVNYQYIRCSIIKFFIVSKYLRYPTLIQEN